MSYIMIIRCITVITDINVSSIVITHIIRSGAPGAVLLIS